MTDTEKAALLGIVCTAAAIWIAFKVAPFFIAMCDAGYGGC